MSAYLVITTINTCITLIIAGYYFNNGTAHMKFQEIKGFVDTPLELKSRHVFVALMRTEFGFVCIAVAIALLYLENPFFWLTSAWTIGWWLGYFQPTLSEEERMHLRKILGPAFKDKDKK